MKKFINPARPALKPKDLELPSNLLTLHSKDEKAKNPQPNRQTLPSCQRNCAECHPKTADLEPKIEQKEVKYA
jgi:hypothetical protein